MDLRGAQQLHRRCAQRAAAHLHRLPPHVARSTERLRERFFRGEAPGHGRRVVAAATGQVGELARREDALGEARTVALERARDAFDGRDVDAEPDDHFPDSASGDAGCRGSSSRGNRPRICRANEFFSTGSSAASSVEKPDSQLISAPK